MTVMLIRKIFLCRWNNPRLSAAELSRALAVCLEPGLQWLQSLVPCSTLTMLWGQLLCCYGGPDRVFQSMQVACTATRPISEPGNAHMKPPVKLADALRQM